MKISEIGETFDKDYVGRISFFSEDYLLDPDILIIDLEHIKKEISDFQEEPHEQVPFLTAGILKKLIQKIEQRKKQLLEYFNNGGNLFVQTVTEKKWTFDVRNSEGDISQTSFDVFELLTLESKDYTIDIKKGSNIIFPDPLFHNFFSSFDCSYRFTYTKYNGTSLGVINNTKQCVSVLTSKSRGNIILLPTVFLNAESWEDFQDLNSSFVKELTSLNAELKNRYKVVSEFSVPEWCSGYYLSNEGAQVNKLNHLYQERDNLLQKITAQQTLLSTYADLKVLLFATATLLEEKVEQVFREFGYEILSAEDNRDDLIIKYKDEIAVIEIKGQKGSGSEANAAQLMKWVSSYHVDHGYKPKGILIVNAFKDKPLAERLDQDFPEQMLPFSTKMELTLMSSTQLLGLYLDFKRGEISFKNIHKLLWNTVGRLEYSINQISKI